MNFGEFVYSQRKRAGLTQSQLAALLGIKKEQTILCWERGYNEPQERLVIRVARWCDRPVAEIAGLLPGIALPTKDTVAGRIRLARWDMYSSREEFSSLIGTNAPVLKRWEDGEALPRDDSTDRLAAVIGDIGTDGPPANGILAWYGKKLRNLPKLLEMIPSGDTYVEPYGGSATVLMARDPAPNEIYNDINSDLTNLFRTLREPSTAGELKERLSLTLHSRAEHSHAAAVLCNPASTSVDRAWAFFVIMNQGFAGRESLTTGNWNRLPRAGHWWKRIAWLDWWHERLANVVIEETDALDLLRSHDDKDAVLYLDPPYVRSARASQTPLYTNEIDDAHHAELVDLIFHSKASVVLAGYPSPIYEPLADAGWESTQLGADVIWRNERACLTAS